MTRPIDAFTDQPPELFNQTVQLKNELAEAKAEVERLGEVIESRHAAHAKRVNELEQQLTAAQQAKEAAEERAEKAEREHEGTLKERVECEECIDKMYLDVVGQPAQWSNNFDYKDAADMVEQVAFARDQEIGRHINAREVAESRVYELEAENAKLLKILEAIASTREQQLTAATQAREAAQQRAEKAEQEVRLFEEIYGGGAESISKALHDRAEVAESRVYELEAENAKLLKILEGKEG